LVENKTRGKFQTASQKVNDDTQTRGKFQTAEHVTDCHPGTA
jgi:hypothetical protein